MFPTFVASPNGKRIKVKGARGLQPQKHRCRISARVVDRRHRRFGFGQIDTCRRNSLSRRCIATFINRRSNRSNTTASKASTSSTRSSRSIRNRSAARRVQIRRRIRGCLRRFANCTRCCPNRGTRGYKAGTFFVQRQRRPLRGMRRRRA